MGTAADLARIQQAHHRQILGLRSTAAELVDDAWLAYAGLDDRAAARFTAAAAQVMGIVTARAGVLTAGYLGANDAVLNEFADIVPTIPTIRGGVPTADVYQRSIVEARRLVSTGTPYEQALDAGRARATSTARTDVMLANKQSIDDAAARRPWVVGYRRVLTGRSCALCATASTQRYKRANLAPIHSSCDCDVAEIYGTADPGRVINRQLLDDLSAAGKADGQPEYWKGPYVVDADGTIHYKKTEYVRNPETGKRVTTEAGNPVRRVVPGEPVKVKVQNHGELGPTLTDSRHKFTGPAAVKPTLPPGPATRGKPITAGDANIRAEAARRGLDPVKLAAQRESKRISRLEEQAAARNAARAINVDNPDVIRVAERYGVSPDELVTARARIPDLKKLIAEEAAQVQAQAFDEFYAWNISGMRGPGTFKGQRPGEYDWLERLDQREKSRLARKWFTNDRNASAPDQIIQEMAQGDARFVGASIEDGVEAWLENNRRMDAAGALRRGKLPSERAYSGDIDVDALLPGIADEGYSAQILLAGDEIEAAAHIAQVETRLLADDALRTLENAADPRHGEAPYRMNFQAWEEEVREIEYDIRIGSPTRAQLDRYSELVPPLIDEPGVDFEELYARIVATARQAGEEVPSYARIPWQ